LVRISKEEFQEMMEMGLIKTDKWGKNFSISCKSKKAMRKKVYVVEPDYRNYLWKKSKENSKPKAKGS